MQIFVDAEACPVVGIKEINAKEHYLTMKNTASDCIPCGHCNKQCPFKVMQMERMSKIREYFGK